LIAIYRGFPVIYIIGDLDLTSYVPPMNGFTFVGSGMDRTHINIASDAVVDDCAYRDAHVSGTLDGDSRLDNCIIDNLIYVKGFVERCVLAPGTIVLAGTEEAHFLDCWSGVPGTGTPTIDMGGSGQALALRNYSGGIKLTNKTGPESVSIDLNSGQIELTDTVTNGDIVCRGVGIISENLSNGANVIDQLVNVDNVANGVWLHSTASAAVSDLVFLKSIEGGRWKIESNQMIFYADDNVTEIARFNLLNAQGQPTSTEVYERVRA
jgi:hypothetical protein